VDFRIIGLSLAIGMGATFTAWDARAMPVTRDLASAVADHVVSVRDGCGRGFHWSNRFQACVETGRRGPYHGRRGPRDNGGAAAAAAVVTLGVIGAIAGSQNRHRGPRPGVVHGGGGKKKWKH
jgi:hypothetical protein